MKKLYLNMSVLAPVVAALCIFIGSAVLHVQEMQRMDSALSEQDRLLHVRSELQQARRVLLEDGSSVAAASSHLRALTDLYAGDTTSREHVEIMLQGTEMPEAAARHLDALVSSAAETEARNVESLQQVRATLWQRVWLLGGLGCVAMAYTAFMLLMALLERNRLNDRLKFESTHDSLTSLPNRRFFTQWAERAMAQASRERTQLALLYIDLDGFRHVNDEQGREMGDRLLRVAAQRFRERVRESDVLARVGDDEYVILTSLSNDSASVTPLADRLIASLAEPLLPQFGSRYPVGASIGIAVYPSDGMKVDALIHAAEEAMREAKAAGGNRHHFSSPSAPV